MQVRFGEERPGNSPTTPRSLTLLWTAEGWLYLAIILDLFSRRVVGWAINKRMGDELVISAFNMAFWRRRPDWGLILHSVRGSQYCSSGFPKLLKTRGALSNMSRKSDCWQRQCSG